MRLRPVLATALLCALALPAAAADAPLTTVSERSGFLDTGRYDEVLALCDAFAARYPQSVRCLQFGTTPEDGAATSGAVASSSGLAEGRPSSRSPSGRRRRRRGR